MITSVSRTITLTVLIIVIAISITSCTGILNLFGDFSSHAYSYTNVGEEQIDIISDYYKLEKGKIKSIDEIVYIHYFRENDIHIFASVDWPELWDDYPQRNDSDYCPEHKKHEYGEELGYSFTYDLETVFETERENFNKLYVFRLMDDNKVAIYIPTPEAKYLWEELKDSLE